MTLGTSGHARVGTLGTYPKYVPMCPGHTWARPAQGRAYRAFGAVPLRPGVPIAAFFSHISRGGVLAMEFNPVFRIR